MDNLQVPARARGGFGQPARPKNCLDFAPFGMVDSASEDSDAKGDQRRAHHGNAIELKSSAARNDVLSRVKRVQMLERDVSRCELAPEGTR